uniref:Uncharacterized protein n=1 Tax=Pristionchus pacificus TaxID=54126 RepID=A0A8R1V5P6_PRIPA
MVVNERGMLYFSPEFMLDRDDNFNPKYPPASTVGLLTKILSNASTFIPKNIKFPEEKMTELGYTKAQSGYISLTFETGYCSFNEVMPGQLPPLCPSGGTLGVIIKDMVNETSPLRGLVLRRPLPGAGGLATLDPVAPRRRMNRLDSPQLD